MFAPIYRAAAQLGFLGQLKGMRLHELKWALIEPDAEGEDTPSDLVAEMLRRRG